MSMTMGPPNPPKRHGLFVLAIAAFLCGVVTLISGFNNPLSLAFSGLMIVASAQLVRTSNVYAKGRHADVGSGDTESDDRKRIGPLAWALGAVSTVAVGVSFLFLYEDAAGGYHGIWPVYGFAASAFIASIVWSYVFAKSRN